MREHYDYHYVRTLCEAQKIVSWLGEKEHLFKK